MPRGGRVSKKRPIPMWLRANKRKQQTVDDDAAAEASESRETPLEESEMQSQLEDQGTGYETHDDGSKMQDDHAESVTHDQDTEYGSASFKGCSSPASPSGSKNEGDHAESVSYSSISDTAGSPLCGYDEGCKMQDDDAESVSHEQGPEDESAAFKGFSSSATVTVPGDGVRAVTVLEESETDDEGSEMEAQKTPAVVPITSHVLDTSSGQPAAGMRVSLFKKNPDGDGWLLVNKGTTNSDGRLPGLTSPGSTSPGVHMMRFETGEYFSDKKTFYPYVEVVFNIEDNEHYHIPLLLSPYGYSTYRGS